MAEEKSQYHILIVDDEYHQRVILEEAMKSMGYSVTSIDSGQKALEQLRFGNYDVLITDMQMPGMDGLRLLENARIYDSSVSVILVTAHGSIETAVEAMKKGAEDYLPKPIEFTELEVVLEQVFKKRALVRENRMLISENELLKKDLRIRYHVTHAIGKSPVAQKLLSEIQDYMKNAVPLLILGESGVGKDEIAKMLHYNGPRSNQSLILFDCAEIPEELHETQLFGEEAALQSGVKISSRPGLVEKSHLGTLVLSNIHRLNKKCQPNISRVMREEKTQRTGGIKFYPVSTRVVATSERSEFDRRAKQDEIRWDIYDLLLEHTIDVPPLRERKEDIPILIAATAKRIGQALDKTIEKIDKPVVDQFLNYDFPGNLRELSLLVETAVIRCDGSTLKLEHFSFLPNASPKK